ncbi:MAG: cell division protein CrgA [Actinobacteria bacterium]|nr:MAG: cell division protein CrgA [Actinomycetota bacterium]
MPRALGQVSSGGSLDEGNVEGYPRDPDEPDGAAGYGAGREAVRPDLGSEPRLGPGRGDAGAPQLVPHVGEERRTERHQREAGPAEGGSPPGPPHTPRHHEKRTARRSHRLILSGVDRNGVVMPRSKSKRRRYQSPPKKKPKPSPTWVGVLILLLMFSGVIVIVLNYLGLVPGTHSQATNLYLFVGLGLIAAGFVGATQWR